MTAWGNWFGNSAWLACCFISLHLGKWLPRVITSSSSESVMHFRNLEIKLDDIKSMDIFRDAQMLTYLQIGELDVRLTFKEKDGILQKSKRYHWKGQHLFKIWQDGHVQVVPRPKCEKTLWNMPIGVGTFWGTSNLQFASRPILVERHVVGGSIVCFTMHSMWLSSCII